MKRKFFHCPAENLDEFRAAAEAAAKLGVTHVYVSELPKSRWQWDMDRTDPYPNWGMMHAALFKVYVPEKLREYLPCDYAEKNLRIVADRCAILKKYGLKAAFQKISDFFKGWTASGRAELAHLDQPPSGTVEHPNGTAYIPSFSYEGISLTYSAPQPGEV